MFVYKKSEAALWTVGHYDPNGVWLAESDHESTDEAANRCSFLNGGGVNSKTVTRHRPVRKIEWMIGGEYNVAEYPSKVESLAQSAEYIEERVDGHLVYAQVIEYNANGRELRKHNALSPTIITITWAD